MKDFFHLSFCKIMKDFFIFFCKDMEDVFHLSFCLNLENSFPRRDQCSLHWMAPIVKKKRTSLKIINLLFPHRACFHNIWNENFSSQKKELIYMPVEFPSLCVSIND